MTSHIQQLRTQYDQAKDDKNPAKCVHVLIDYLSDDLAGIAAAIPQGGGLKDKILVNNQDTAVLSLNMKRYALMLWQEEMRLQQNQSLNMTDATLNDILRKIDEFTLELEDGPVTRLFLRSRVGMVAKWVSKDPRKLSEKLPLGNEPIRGELIAAGLFSLSSLAEWHGKDEGTPAA